MFNRKDHIICLDDCYGGTNRFLRTIAVNMWKMDVTFFDFSKINDKNMIEIDKILRDNTKAVFIETCTNPTLKSV